MLGANSQYVAAEIWTDLPCVPGAERVADLLPEDVQDPDVVHDVSGDHEFTLTLRRACYGAAFLAEGRVLHARANDGQADDWDLRAESGTTSPGETVTWTAKPWLQRLASTPWVSQTYANGLVAYAIPYANATAFDILTDLIAFLNQTSVGFPFVVLGTVEATQQLSSFSVSYTNALAVIRALEVATDSICWPRYDAALNAGAGGYYLDLLLAPNTADEPVDLSLGAELLQLTRKRDIIESASVINVVGMTKGDGLPGTLGETAFAVSATAAGGGNDVDLVDPLGGPGPVQFDGELDGLFAGPVSSAAVSTSLTHIDMSAYSTLGCRIRVASVANLAAGQTVRIFGNATYYNQMFVAVITSVDVPNLDLYFATIPMPFAGVALTPPSYAPPLPAIFDGGSIYRAPVYSRALVSNSLRISQTTSRITLPSITGVAVGDRLDFTQDAAGTPIVSLTNPAALALFGGATTPPRPRVVTISVPDRHGLRNYAPAPLMAPWPPGVSAPTDWTLGASVGVSASRDTVNVLPGQTESLRIASNTSATVVQVDLHSKPIVLLPRPGGDYVMFKAVVFVTTLTDAAQLDLYIGHDVSNPGGSPSTFIQPIPSSMVHATGTPVNPNTTTPAPNGTVFKNLAQVTMTTPPIDASQFYVNGLRLGLKVQAYSGGIFSVTAPPFDLSVQGVVMVRGTWMPDGVWVESDSIEMWQEGNRQLAYRGSPIDDLALTMRDLYRANPTLHPFSQLRVGRGVTMLAPSLGVQKLAAQITRIEARGAVPEDSSITVSTKPRKLAPLSSGNAGSGGSTGGGVGGPPPPTVTPTPGGGGGGGGGGGSAATPSPFPIDFVAQTEWWEVTATPSVSDEPTKAIRRRTDLRYIPNGALQIVGGPIAAPAGTLAVAKYSADQGTTWTALDHASGPSVACDGLAEGEVRQGALVNFNALARTGGDIWLGLFFEGGDDATDALFGQCSIIAQPANTPNVITGPYNPPPTLVQPPQANLILWLQSDLGITASGGTPNTVSRWKDQSPSGTDATQVTGSKQPRYDLLSSGLMNNQPYLHFDGTDDELEVDLSNLLTAAEWTIYVVCGRDIGVEQYYLGTVFGGPPALNALRFGWYSDTEIGLDQGFFSFSATGIPNFATTSGRLTCLAARSGGGVHLGGDGREIRSMGDVLVNVASALPGGGGTDGRVGRAQSKFLKGPVWLVLAYDVAHTPTQMTAVESFITQKFGPDVVPVDS